MDTLVLVGAVLGLRLGDLWSEACGSTGTANQHSTLWLRTCLSFAEECRYEARPHTKYKRKRPPLSRAK
jgi:hypothetical protein